MDLKMQLELSDKKLAVLFGLPTDKSEDALIVEAAATIARNRYAGAPWESDRISDAALAVTEALQNYVAQEGRNVLHTKANYALGQASGLTRNAAVTESNAEEFVTSFSDLVPVGIEDPEQFVESLLGEGAVYSPVSAKAYREDWEFNPDNVVFYTTDGVLNLRQVAERVAHSAVSQELLAEMFTGEDFTAVEDLTEAVYDRLAVWAAATDARVEFRAEEVEPESCPLDKVWVSYDGGRNWWLETRRGMGCNAVAPQLPGDENEDPDYAYEAWAVAQDVLKGAANDDGWSGAWCEQVNPDKMWFSYERTSNGQLIEHLDPVGDTVAAIRDARNALPKAERKGVTIDQLLDASELEALVEPAIEYAYDLALSTAIEDVSLNEAMTEFAWQVSSGAKVKGTFAAIRSLVTEDLDLRNEEIEDLPLSTQGLRDAIKASVDAGEMFASRALVVLAKLDGKTNQYAAQLADSAFELSKARKSLFNQKRFSVQAETILAERVYPGFKLGLPKNLVGITGNVPFSFAQQVLAKLDHVGVVGCESLAKDIAEKLGLPYVEIPLAGEGWLPLQWGRGQVMATATHVVAHMPEAAMPVFEGWMRGTNADYRVLLESRCPVCHELHTHVPTIVKHCDKCAEQEWYLARLRARWAVED